MNFSGKNICFIFTMSVLLIFSSCKSWNKSQKGAVIGTAAGAGAGAVIGRASGNTALGAIIGAAVGGTAGVLIGRQMDKQAREIESKLPDAKVERIGEGILVELNDKILFNFDKSDLTSEAKTNLNKFITVLKDYPETNIEIQGHTDNVGTESYNKGLSKRRASSVNSYLASNGVKSGRLSTRGFGEAAPAYENSTAENQALNRRVDFLITANSKMKADAKKDAKSQ